MVANGIWCSLCLGGSVTSPRVARQASSDAKIDATPTAQQMVEGLRRLDSICDHYIVSHHGQCGSYAQRAKASYTGSSNSLATHSDHQTAGLITH